MTAGGPARRHFFETKAPGHAPRNARAISELLSRIGDKWSVLVVSPLGEGPQRFSALKRRDRRHLAEDADDDAAQSRARRLRHAHRLPDHPAAGRIRADAARARTALPGRRARAIGRCKNQARVDAARESFDRQNNRPAAQRRRCPLNVVGAEVSVQPSRLRRSRSARHRRLLARRRLRRPVPRRAGDGWMTYVNDRFGMRSTIRPAFLRRRTPPENGDGRSFNAKDARSRSTLRTTSTAIRRTSSARA